MLYELSNPMQAEQAAARLRFLTEKGVRCEITEKRSRTLSQNNYLHLIISYFGLLVGERAEYVKRNYYKLHCNRDLYLREKQDKILGTITHILRSSADLTKEEMSLSIDRFIRFASDEAGINLPTPEQGAYLAQIEVEVSRAQRWL